MSSGSRKNVRWDDKRSGSSRASTTGASSSGGSSYSESYSDHRYNIAALESSLQSTINELDDWKNKALKAEEQLRKCQKEKEEAKARIAGLETQNEKLVDDNEDLERQNREWKEKYAKLQKKLEKAEGRSDSPPSPDGGKPRRRESKSSRESDTDKHTARLKERFNRSGDSTSSSETTSKPPSTSRATHGGRRLSVTIADKPYMEGWGPGPAAAMPTSPVAPRRPPNYVTTSYPVTTSAVHSPAVSATPRSAGGMQRPTVECTTYAYPEGGNHHRAW